MLFLAIIGNITIGYCNFYIMCSGVNPIIDLEIILHATETENGNEISFDTDKYAQTMKTINLHDITDSVII